MQSAAAGRRHQQHPFVLAANATAGCTPLTSCRRRLFAGDEQGLEARRPSNSGWSGSGDSSRRAGSSGRFADDVAQVDIIDAAVFVGIRDDWTEAKTPWQVWQQVTDAVGKG